MLKTGPCKFCKKVGTTRTLGVGSIGLVCEECWNKIKLGKETIDYLNHQIDRKWRRP